MRPIVYFTADVSVYFSVAFGGCGFVDIGGETVLRAAIRRRLGCCVGWLHLESSGVYLAWIHHRQSGAPPVNWPR